MNALQTMMLNAVVDNIDTLYDDWYEGGTDYTLLPYLNIPYSQAWQFYDTKSRFLTLLASLRADASRDFYWWGHGNDQEIGPVASAVKSQFGLNSSLVAAKLGNQLWPIPMARHSYRLVILDGCAGYCRSWATAFGMTYQANGSMYTKNDYQNRFHLDPQAFVGVEL